MRYITYPIICAIVCSFLAFILFSGEMRYHNKTERGFLSHGLMPIAAIGALVGIFVGGWLASIMNNEEKTEKIYQRIGINTENTKCYKQGRYWVCESKWYDPTTNSNNVLRTAKNGHGIVTSIYNGSEVINHTLSSANQQNILSLHNQAKHHLFSSLPAKTRVADEKRKDGKKQVAKVEQQEPNIANSVPLPAKEVLPRRPSNETSAFSRTFIKDGVIATETRWFDSRNNTEHVLMTCQLNKKIVTLFDSAPYMEHGEKPADNKTISHSHDVAKTTLFHHLGIVQVQG